MSRIKFGDGYAWFGEKDTPAPHDFISNPSPTLTIGVSAKYSGAKVDLFYRRSNSSWRKLNVRKSRRSKDAQYFITQFPRLKLGTRVEYEVRIKSSGLYSIPEQRIGDICWYEVTSKSQNNNTPPVREHGKIIEDKNAHQSDKSKVTHNPSKDRKGNQPVTNSRENTATDASITGKNAEDFFMLDAAALSPSISMVHGGQSVEGTVAGTVRAEDGSPQSNITVRAFDKDMRSEQLLGEAISASDGTYSITYSAEQFRRAEKKSADIIVRAFNENEKQVAESKIHFNVGKKVSINLIITKPGIETTRLSELEQLQESIEPVRENVEYRLFTDDDIVFLTEEETIREGVLGMLERRTISEHLEFLRLAAKFEHDTDILLAAFYGWFRQDQPQVLDELLDVSIRTLRAALLAAIGRNIIPDITAQIPQILERIRSLRFERGRLVNHRFVLQLVNEETGKPLIDYAAEVTDPAAEPEAQDLGTLFTDSRGIIVILFSLPGEALEDTTRQLQLSVFEDEKLVGETVVQTIPNQQEIAVVRIRIQQDERESIAIDGVAPSALAARLRRQGIENLHDLLANPDLSDEDPEGLEQLRGYAKFSVLARELSEDQRTLLLKEGNLGPLDVARKSRAEFVGDWHERLGGDAATYLTHFAAKETSKLLYHTLGSVWIKDKTAPEDDPNDPDIPTGVKETLRGIKKCGCKDCDSVVSPAAYLAHLLDWTLEHIKDKSASIEFSQLEEEFHQPFADLPASCEAVEEQVRQVRICVEVLWRFTGFVNLPDLQMPTSFRNAYRYLRNQLYKTILTNLGTSFEQLRKATLQVEGDSAIAELVASQRRAVADVLGIDESHFDELFFNIEQPPIAISEDELERLFGFKSTRAEDVFAISDTPELVKWQRRRLESIWQEQDWPSDKYRGEGRRPLVDPALINESYFRTPLDQNPAFGLLENRQELLNTHRQALIASNPQQNGLTNLLEDELGLFIAQLRSLYQTLQAGEQLEGIEQTHETIAALHLTPAGFTFIMDIDSRINAGASIGATDEEVDAAWDAVFDILSRAHRHTLFSTWVEEEDDLELIFGPKLFWLPVERVESPNPWQATSFERLNWEEALRRRSGRPIIDPDQIQARHVTAFRIFLRRRHKGIPAALSLLLPSLATYALWRKRRKWINDRLEVLQAAWQGQAIATNSLQTVLEASTLNIRLDIFEELANLEDEGGDLELRLAQLSLTMAEYRFLADIHHLTQGNAAISSNKKQEINAILVMAEKRREFAEWQLAEQEDNITLRPNRFEPQQELASNKAASPQNRWLHDPVAFQQWLETLQARDAQFEALEDALEQAVGDAASAILPLLRNILIQEAVTPENVISFEDKAAWLEKLLLVDMHMDGCHLTTRISQAIETLQRFVRGVHTKEHLDLMQHLTLDADEDYETEWPVIGAYVTWRAFMLAYLYPENLLHVSPPFRQSFGYAQLKKNLPSQVEPPDACAAAEAYGDYFRDVCQLEVQASCQVRTRVQHEGGCEGVTTASSSRVHLFGLAAASGKVYANSFVGYFDAKDTLDTWRPVTGLSNVLVLEIIGAVPHVTSSQQRVILLFVKARQASKIKLMFISYDLDTNDWGKSNELDLPPGTDFDFSAVAVQKRHGNAGGAFGIVPQADIKPVPTLLAIRAFDDGKIYLRTLNSSATKWVGTSWIPLLGYIWAEKIKRVCALVQRSRHEYLMIIQTNINLLQYRIFSVDTVHDRDDGAWRIIGQGDFSGAFFWPGTPEIFVYYQAEAKTKYAVIRKTSDLVSEGFPVSSIVWLNTWLETVVGVSLNDFRLDFTEFFILEDWPEQPDPPSEKLIRIDKSVPIHYVGNLHTLLGLTESRWDWTLPKLNGFEKSKLDKTPSSYRHAALGAAKRRGLSIFQQALNRSASVDYHDPELGWLKLADWYVKKFIDDGLYITVLSVSTIFIGPTFPYRGHVNESEVVATDALAPLDEWNFVPSGGDEEFGSTPRKAVVYREPDGAFRSKLKRTGDKLSGSVRRVTPNGDGPFDLAPLSSTDELLVRGAEIKAFYDNPESSPHSGSPPSVMGYLKEAYNFVPIYLGYELQRNGYYEDALLWYRQVYDYLQANGEQRIDHSLKLEQALKLSYENVEDWLDDASNAHAIAGTRKNTYTRHILLMIIRCLIEYADALFSHDNVTDNTRARELYILALRLLDFKELKPGKSRCENIIGTLTTEIDEPGELPLQQFKSALNQIQNPDQLESVVAALKNISQDTARPAVERLSEMRERVVTALGENPAPKRMAAVLDTKHENIRALENQFLTHKPSRILLEKTYLRRREEKLGSLVEITNKAEEILLQEQTPLPWLRQARPDVVGNGADQRSLHLVLPDPGVPRRLAVLNQIKQALPLPSLTATQKIAFAVNTGLSFDFCIPQNPVISAFRTRAENNLLKLRTCRNIAGFIRQLDPYGAPIGIGSGLVSPDGTIFSGVVNAPPTAYRYVTLITRAKELINIAQQIEAGYQTALEKAENEALALLQAEQNAELANAQITLRDLGLTRANSELGLTQLQKNSAVLREETYTGWIGAGKNEHEKKMLKSYSDASDAKKKAARAQAAASVAQLATQMAGVWTLKKTITGRAAAQAIALSAATASTLAAATFQEQAIGAEARAQAESFEASFERRNDEWLLQQGLAALDVQIGDQQIQLARDGIAIARQERVIAGLGYTHALDILSFLHNKDFTEEMHRWIASVLEDIYRFFLQEAASISRLAERQLAFERQQAPLKVIQTDYWNIPIETTGSVLAANSENRLGLTGSARLLKDIYQLDNYAFETRQSKQALTITLDLAEMFPAEFQRFRETGVLVFETPMNLIHRQFPGYYLCLIQNVTVSVAALIPPTYGIRATLTSAGTSRVVVGGDIFQTVIIRNLPERMALTAASTTSGVIELEPNGQSLLNPFESSGFNTLWELRMPKASNPFDYSSMATVLLTVDMTALHSFDYERQVIESLDRTVSLDRAFDFRQVFADPWYDLNNPDQTATPMTVRFETRRSDFPSNLTNLAIQHVVLYIVRKDGEMFEQEILYLRFTPEGFSGYIGGPSATVDGRVSTRSGNGTNWLPMIGLPPIGQWELAFPDNPPSDTEARDRFSEEQIENLLLVISFSGKLPNWPM